MMEGLKPYPKMKDSGVPWLGRVPEHWNIQRIRDVATMLVSNVDKHSHEGELPVRLCNYVDVYRHDVIRPEMAFMCATATEAEIGRFRLQREDVLITKDSETWTDIGVPAYVFASASDLVCGYHLAILRPHASTLDGQYLFFAMQSNGVAHQLHVEATGVTRFGLSHDSVRSTRLTVPPLPEQIAIRDFLGSSANRIRRLIRSKQKLVTLLEEQKQAIIHRAVTRGLESKVRLKPSGISWVGDVPEHWDVMRCRHLFREVDARSPYGSELHLSMSQRLGLVPSNLVDNRTLVSESYAGGKLCQIGDLVLNRLKAHLGVFSVARHAGVISPDYTVLRPLDPVGVDYFEKVLRSPACRRELRIRAKGIVEGFWRLYTDDFYDIRLPSPPAAERLAIIDQFTASTNSVTKSVIAAQSEIDLLKELRTRLISDVVTGKLDVREAAARLPADSIEGDDLLDDADADIENVDGFYAKGEGDDSEVDN
jgi:type I restriction enzyme S subunit